MAWRVVMRLLATNMHLGQTAANLTPQLSGQFYDQEKLNEERWRTATYYNPLVNTVRRQRDSIDFTE